MPGLKRKNNIICEECETIAPNEDRKPRCNCRQKNKKRRSLSASHIRRTIDFLKEMEPIFKLGEGEEEEEEESDDDDEIEDSNFEKLMALIAEDFVKRVMSGPHTRPIFTNNNTIKTKEDDNLLKNVHENKEEPVLVHGMEASSASTSSIKSPQHSLESAQVTSKLTLQDTLPYMDDSKHRRDFYTQTLALSHRYNSMSPPSYSTPTGNIVHVANNGSYIQHKPNNCCCCCNK